jgi:hypothetical protein
MGDGRQVTDRARPNALLLAMVTLVAVVALDLPVHVNRRDAVLDDEMLLDRSWRVEVDGLGAQVNPQHIVRFTTLGCVAARRVGLGGWPSGRLAVHGLSASLQ